MKIALIGYGRMGQEIEKIALSRGHEIVLTIDIHNLDDFTPENLKKADVAISYTIPETAIASYKKCFDAGIPVVSGTTGWLENWDDVTEYCTQKVGSFFYASNFSLGVNIFFELNKTLAKYMKSLDDYEVSMCEIHHTKKLDSPSGTAISLAEGIMDQNPRYKEWVNKVTNNNSELGIVSIREGDVPGIHTIKYESEVDFIEITHNAKSRKGFAFGSVIAAEFLKGKTGIYSMKDLMKFIL
jgi:4-hydroxy-tetrahydrodipicolinate reductase